MNLELKVPSDNLKNRIAILILFVAGILFFGHNDVAFVYALIVFSVMFILNVDYSLGTIMSCYFLIPADYYPFMQVPSPLGNLPLYVVLYAGFIAISLIRFALRYGTIEIDRYLFIAFILLLFGEIICSALYDASTILPSAVKFFFQMFGMMFLVKLRELKREDFKKIYQLIFILICMTIFVAIQESMFGYNVYNIFGSEINSARYDWNHSINSIWRSTATFGNSLVFSCSLIMCFPVLEYYRKEAKFPTLVYTALTILAVGTILSGSRSGIFGCVLYVGYLLIKNRRGLIGAIVIIPACLYLVFSYVDTSAILSRFTTQGISSAHRANAYTLFFDVFLKYPIFGTGIGRSYAVLSEYISSTFVTNTFDNTLFDGALTFGIWGIFALFLAFSGVYKKIKWNTDKKEMLFVILCFTYISLFLNAIKYQSLWGMLWFYIAVSYYMDDDCQEANNQEVG